MTALDWVVVLSKQLEKTVTQKQLEREVAEALGEDLQEIRRRGFSLADPLDVDFDPEPDDLPPQVVDWDSLDARRRTSFGSVIPARPMALPAVVI